MSLIVMRFHLFETNDYIKQVMTLWIVPLLFQWERFKHAIELQ